MNRATYVGKQGEGHHGDFEIFFSKVAASESFELEFVNDPNQARDTSIPLLYSMYDTEPRASVAAILNTIRRTLYGYRTVGLFFRPGDCFGRSSIKAIARRMMYRLASRLPKAHVLSIVPFDLAPQFATVATSWIYDPQLWDLSYLDVPTLSQPEALDLDRQLSDGAQGRKLIVALGGQNRLKGFDWLADLWCSSARIQEQYFFVVAGKVANSSKEHARRFTDAGGFLIDRHIDNAELFHLYSKSYAVWSCYAPDYDQSSGINGRAIQLGLPVLVRETSLLEALGVHLDHPTLALPFDSPTDAEHRLVTWSPDHVSDASRIALVDRMRAHSLDVLRRTLFQRV